MIIHDRSLPHPVLTPFRDDVSPGVFDLSVNVTSDADSFYLEVSFSYQNETIAKLIEDGSAVHSIHIECRRNYYRELFSFKSSRTTLRVPASKLVGRVEVCGFVTSRLPLESYKITGSHPDYGDTAFKIQPGDILALAPTQRFEAYVDYDPLKQISSILMIERSETVAEGPMTLDTSGDRIVVTLSQKDYERYTDLKADPQLGPLLGNQVVVPALIEAVHEIRGASEENFEFDMMRRWFRSVVKKLADNGIDVRKPDKPVLQIVQQLLQLPLRRSLEGLIQMNPAEDKA